MDAVPENIVAVHDGADEAGIWHVAPEASFEVDGVEFVLGYRPESTPERFFLVKTLSMVERYRSLWPVVSGATVFELGIREGGSTVWIALEGKPAKLIAIDIEPDRLAPLDAFIAARGLGDVVRPYWGVDQSDRARLRTIVADEVGTDPLDLVIDDASHILGPTRASFETLFPLLRPGGLYLIEDWNASHLFYDALATHYADTSAPDYDERAAALQQWIEDPTPRSEATPPPEPLSRIAIELLLARASSGDAVAEVVVSDVWVAVRRGPGALDPTTFRLRDLYIDHFGLDPSSTRPD